MLQNCRADVGRDGFVWKVVGKDLFVGEVGRDGVGESGWSGFGGNPSANLVHICGCRTFCLQNCLAVTLA
jgi:hypothetical protein